MSLTRKSLYTSHIDVGAAPRQFSERYQLQDVPDHCSDPAEHTKDEYGRIAHPYSLPFRGHGACNMLSPHHNVQAVLARENALDRPFIPVAYPLGAGQGYDTMNFGRDMMEPAAGSDGSGGWYKLPMPKAAQLPASCRPPVHRASDSHAGPSSLAPMFQDRY